MTEIEFSGPLCNSSIKLAPRRLVKSLFEPAKYGLDFFEDGKDLGAKELQIFKRKLKLITRDMVLLTADNS